LGFGAWAVSENLQEWLNPMPVAAQTAGFAAWTAIGASGTVDELSIPTFGFTGPSAGYRPTASLQPLEFRYNVVNTHHQVAAGAAIPSIGMPGWTTREFGAQAPGNSVAEAYLYRVNRCTGQQVLFCQVRHSNQPAPGACRPCYFANNWFNFASYLYYVRVVLYRTTPNDQPMVHTLRIY
jgi:hypothetical protein